MGHVIIISLGQKMLPLRGFDVMYFFFWGGGENHEKLGEQWHHFIPPENTTPIPDKQCNENFASEQTPRVCNLLHLSFFYTRSIFSEVHKNDPKNVL